VVQFINHPDPAIPILWEPICGVPLKLLTFLMECEQEFTTNFYKLIIRKQYEIFILNCTAHLLEFLCAVSDVINEGFPGQF
jgi:hypothetical protein